MVRRRHHSLQTIEENYVRWLYDQVSDRNDRGYYNLLYILNSVSFSDEVGNDKNRSYEGRMLRSEYDQEHPSANWRESDWAKINWCPCTFLEMMIALARRLEELTYNPYNSDEDTSTSRWFWEMIANLKFGKYDDEWFGRFDDDPRYYKELSKIHQTLEKINTRTCIYTKKGCLFPLQKNPEKVSQMEIWDQANEYLIENYPIID